MDPILASYDYRYGNNAWLYQLHPNRVVATGHNGPQNHVQVFELAQYYEHPNRTTRIEYQRRKGVAAFAAVAFFLIGVFVSIALFEQNIIPEGPMFGAIGGLFGLAILVYYLLLSASTRSQPLTVVQFKQHDNKDSFVVWLIGDDNREGFEYFVEKTRAIIRSLHQAR